MSEQKIEVPTLEEAKQTLERLAKWEAYPSFVRAAQVALTTFANQERLLDAHRKFHQTVGCPGFPECDACTEEIGASLNTAQDTGDLHDA